MKLAPADDGHEPQEEALEAGSHTGVEAEITCVVTCVNQAHFLREAACDELQGFLFSRPISAEVLKKLAKQGGVDAKVGEAEQKLNEKAVPLALAS